MRKRKISSYAMRRLAEGIRANRLRMQLTASELAFVCEVPLSTICDLEWSRCNDIDMVTVSKICDALMCNLFSEPRKLKTSRK